MRLKVVGHRVLVKPEEIAKKTESGLWKPDQVVEQEQHGLNRGVVIAIGESAWMRPELGNGISKCEVGDTILWPRYAGGQVTSDGVKYMLVNDEDVLVVELPEEVRPY